MKLLLDGLRAIDARKVTEYLLNDEHEFGGPKAKFFKAFGFTLLEPLILEMALLRHPDDAIDGWNESTLYGLKSVIIGPLHAPDGRRPLIRTVWMRSPKSNVHRLTSAYPAK
jgi:hypothetical protein